MTLKGGTSQACAACKYRRRKCTPECLLAPYFPPDQPKMFQNAHKLFGVSNIVKILRSVDVSQKTDAVTSIVCQANIRDRYPVHGCLGFIHQLRYQIWQSEEELHAVLSQLEMYRQNHHHHQQQQQQQQDNQISCMTDDVPSQLELGMAPPSNALPLFAHPTPQTTYYNAMPALPIAQQQSYSNNSYAVGYNSIGLESKDNAGNSPWPQHAYAINSNTNSMGIQSHSVATLVQDYDEMRPFFDTVDDRQSYINSKEDYDSNSEGSLKDTTQSIEHVAENELKCAAAHFSLTSVN